MGADEFYKYLKNKKQGDSPAFFIPDGPKKDYKVNQLIQSICYEQQLIGERQTFQERVFQSKTKTLLI